MESMVLTGVGVDVAALACSELCLNVFPVNKKESRVVLVFRRRLMNLSLADECLNGFHLTEC